MTHRYVAAAALSAVSVVLGLAMHGIAQFVAVMLAILVFVVFLARTDPRTRSERRVNLKLTWSGWLFVPMITVAAALLTLPLLAYASLGVANAVFSLALARFSEG
jgi:FtsH-binding integral membrane protein